jgi:hypothetical protein
MLVATAFLAAPLVGDAARPVHLDAVRVRNAFDAREKVRAAALRTLAVGIRQTLGAASSRARTHRTLTARAIGVRVARIEAESARAAIIGAAASVRDTFGASTAHGVAERERATAILVGDADGSTRCSGGPSASAVRRAGGAAEASAGHSRAGARTCAPARARRRSRGFAPRDVELEEARLFRRASEGERRGEGRSAAAPHRGAFSPRRRRSSSSRAFGASGDLG